MSRSIRIKNCFDQCRAANRPAFIAYITGGDPNPQQCLEVVDRLVAAGIDLLEMGVPFADPLADGPTNQASAQRALDAGTGIPTIHDLLRQIRAKYPELPIVLYTYLNSLISGGSFRDSAKAMIEAGADGFLLLDLPPGEGAEYRAVLDEEDLGLVTLAAPTTAEARLKDITEAATEFIYYVSQVGVTGERSNIASDLAENINHIKGLTEKPVVVGFGISAPEHIQNIRANCNTDGIVVGSAIVKRIAAIADGKGTLEELENFVRSLTDACQ